eukprot:7391246-Prymnesium_polylepis.2
MASKRLAGGGRALALSHALSRRRAARALTSCVPTGRAPCATAFWQGIPAAPMHTDATIALRRVSEETEPPEKRTN